jgi:nucleotide-binding universal stress UspA family protein
MNPKKIVVGVNGSAASNPALDWAIREAERDDAEIIAVHALRPFGGNAPALSVADVRLREFAYLGVATQLRVKRELLGPLTTSGVRHRLVIVEGHPAIEILRVAETEDARVVVVGGGLHSTVDDLFPRSAAGQLTHRARRPVAIVRAKPATAEVVGRARGAAVARRQTRSHRDGDHMDEVAAAALREGR